MSVAAMTPPTNALRPDYRLHIGDMPWQHNARPAGQTSKFVRGPIEIHPGTVSEDGTLLTETEVFFGEKVENLKKEPYIIMNSGLVKVGNKTTVMNTGFGAFNETHADTSLPSLYPPFGTYLMTDTAGSVAIHTWAGVELGVLSPRKDGLQGVEITGLMAEKDKDITLIGLVHQLFNAPYSDEPANIRYSSDSPINTFYTETPFELCGYASPDCVEFIYVYPLAKIKVEIWVPLERLLEGADEVSTTPASETKVTMTPEELKNAQIRHFRGKGPSEVAKYCSSITVSGTRSNTVIANIGVVDVSKFTKPKINHS